MTTRELFDNVRKTTDSVVDFQNELVKEITNVISDKALVEKALVACLNNADTAIAEVVANLHK